MRQILKSKHLLLSKKLDPRAASFNVCVWMAWLMSPQLLSLWPQLESSALYLRSTVISMILLQKDIPQGDQSQMQLSGQNAEAVPAEPGLPLWTCRGQGCGVGLRQSQEKSAHFVIT